jgi:Cu(I)/Ag(I) efflux system membrane fusion protein
MNTKKNLMIVIAVLSAAAAAGGAYWAGLHKGQRNSAEAASAGKAAAANGKQVLYWHDPMVPGPRFDKPGKSPFMDMQLVPVYAGAAGEAGGVSINPGLQQNLGIRLAEVKEQELAPILNAVGNVAWNERDVTLVQARANGYVERLYVRAPLDAVHKGQPLAELVIPDWVAAQEEFLTAQRLSPELAAAARQRMQLAGMPEDLIAHVVANGKVQARMTIHAPQSGVVTELSVREGMTLATGAPMFRVQGLGTVWVNAEIPEASSALVRPGLQVEASTPALPGGRFQGKVGAMLPEVNGSTRTLQARIELSNPKGELVPGMFANVRLAGRAGKPVLTVPTEAIIQTGERSVVFISSAEGRFQPVEVETGIEQGGRTEIRKGLQAGQKVVASGQFLVDSEASLKGTAARMGGDK